MWKVEDISTSHASLDENASALAYLSLLKNEQKWLVYDSRLQDVKSMVERYVNNHACIRLPFDTFYGMKPVHVLHFTGGEHGQLQIWGLLYSNGAVVTVKSESEDFIRFWLDQDTARLFNYSAPSWIK